MFIDEKFRLRVKRDLLACYHVTCESILWAKEATCHLFCLGSGGVKNVLNAFDKGSIYMSFRFLNSRLQKEDSCFLKH